MQVTFQHQILHKLRTTFTCTIHDEDFLAAPMSSSTDEDRAIGLAKDAVDLAASGKAEVHHAYHAILYES